MICWLLQLWPLPYAVLNSYIHSRGFGASPRLLLKNEELVPPEDSSQLPGLFRIASAEENCPIHSQRQPHLATGPCAAKAFIGTESQPNFSLFPISLLPSPFMLTPKNNPNEHLAIQPPSQSQLPGNIACDLHICRLKVCNLQF